MPCSGCQSSTPNQDLIFVDRGSSPSNPSQYTPPSDVSATLVKMVFLEMVSIAIGLVFTEVPGKSKKNQVSDAYNTTFPLNFIIQTKFTMANNSSILVSSPGATPKNPASGLMARSFPSLSNLIQAMSSPTQVILYSGRADFIIAKFVFPQALGKAAAKYFFSPSEFSIPKIYNETPIIK